MEQVGWFWRYRANDTRAENSKWWFTASEPAADHVEMWEIDVIGAYADPKELKTLG